MATPLSIHALDCPVLSVTVFNDRAEVTRQVSVRGLARGDYILVIDGVTRFADSDSIRVKGSGHVVLQEVATSQVTKAVAAVTETPDNAESAAVAAQQLRAVQEEVEALQRQLGQIGRNKQLWDQNVRIRLARPKTEQHLVPEILEAHLSAALETMEADAKKQAEFVADAQAVEDQLELKNKHMAVLKQRIREGAGSSQRTQQFWDVTVVLSATQPTDADLQLVYMTSNASWAPAYDIRITSTSTDMELTYHGLLQQSTEEDWKDCQLVLSTATPSVGGAPPALSTHTVSQYYAPPPMRAFEHRNLERVLHDAPVNRQAMMFDGLDMEEDADESLGAPPAPLPAAAVATTAVEQKGGSATFTIDRKATIVSDNKPHKVTVTVITLESNFRYYCVPALSPHAYLQAMTTNTSEYLLLASTAVNVFFDGDFVAHSKLDLVNPGERFNNFLGVDSTVKVDYKSIPSHHSSAGMLSRTAVAAYKFHTTVKNTKAFDIRFILADMLPRSEADSIRVRLITPTQEDVDAGAQVEAKNEANGAAPFTNMVAQNKVTNNIVWSRIIKAGQEVVIPFEYMIESPAGQAIEIA